MHRATLEAVGLKTEFNIPAGILFSPDFEPERYGLKEDDMKTIGVLRDFVAQYNREIPVDDRRPVMNASQAVQAMYPTLRGLDHEEVWALFLSKANLPIRKELICTGSHGATVIDTRKVIKDALELNADGVILFHNHPSGNPMPSHSDIAETSKLSNALKVFDLSLVDHLIISDSKYYSFTEEKVIRMTQGK